MKKRMLDNLKITQTCKVRVDICSKNEEGGATNTTDAKYVKQHHHSLFNLFMVRYAKISQFPNTSSPTSLLKNKSK